MHWNLGLCSTWATYWFALPHGKISSKELLPIALACTMWAKYWKGLRLVCHCDNAAVVAIINSGSSKKTLVMDLMRSLFFISAYYKFVVSARFLPGSSNQLANAVSSHSTRRQAGYPLQELQKVHRHRPLKRIRQSFSQASDHAYL